MEQCSKCKEYKPTLFGGKTASCHCKEFLIIDEDGDEHQVIAHSEHSAAMKYAEESNVNGDYYLMNECIDITVNGKPYAISAEPDVYYSAKPTQRAE